MQGNGFDLGALKQLADYQDQQQAALNAAVQTAVANPVRITTLQICAVAYDVERGVLMIGSPSGERIDVPLVEAARLALKAQLAGGD